MSDVRTIDKGWPSATIPRCASTPPRLRDTRANYIDDPRVIVRFAHKEFGTGPVTELP